MQSRILIRNFLREITACILTFRSAFTLLCLLVLASCDTIESTKIELSSEEITWIKQNQKIRLAPFPSYHPAEFIDENGEHKGIAADYLSIIKKRTGLQIQLVPTKDWSQTLQFLKEKKIDLVALASQTKERKDYAIFTRPYLDFPMVVITTKNVLKPWPPQMLYNKRVAVVKGYAAQKYLRTYHSKIKILTVRNEIEGLRKTSFGEVTAFITDLSSASYYINKEGINNLRVNNELPYRYKLSYAIRNDWPLLKSILEKSLDSISEKKKNEIFNKWVSLRLKSPLLTRNFILSSLTILLIIVLFTLYFLSRNKSLRHQLRIKSLQREISKKEIEQAQFKSQSQTRFLANMSHEIRTPLNAIIGFASLIDEKELSDANQVNIKNIKSSSNLLLTLMNNILDVSKLEANQLPLNEKPNDLLLLLEEVFEIANKIISESQKNVTIIKDFSESRGITVICDKTRLMQILINLIENSVKFTNEGSIEIFFEVLNNQALIFKIRDTGIGVSEENKSKLFKEFSQVDSKNSRNQGGAGLGLAISEMLINLMGGEIWLESHNSSHIGTTVSFSLPYKNASSTNIVVGKENIPTEKLSSNKHILIIDDNDLNRILMKKILQKYNFTLHEAENGKTGIQYLLDNPNIDLVLMDIQMPVLDGLSATKEITALQKDKVLKHIPIIAVSANALKTEKDEAMESGCDEYLTKPVNSQELLSTIQKYLN